MIRESDELEEIFVIEGDDQKVKIPNLECVVFENLPSLSHAQRIQFQAVKNRIIRNCQKLSLESTKIHALSASYFRNDPEFVGISRLCFDNNYKKRPKATIVVMKIQKPLKKLPLGLKLKHHQNMS